MRFAGVLEGHNILRAPRKRLTVTASMLDVTTSVAAAARAAASESVSISGTMLPGCPCHELEWLWRAAHARPLISVSVFGMPIWTH